MPNHSVNMNFNSNLEIEFPISSMIVEELNSLLIELQPSRKVINKTDWDVNDLDQLLNN